jgi:hypothetical protein
LLVLPSGDTVPIDVKSSILGAIKAAAISLGVRADSFDLTLVPPVASEFNRRGFTITDLQGEVWSLKDALGAIKANDPRSPQLVEQINRGISEVLAEKPLLRCMSGRFLHLEHPHIVVVDPAHPLGWIEEVSQRYGIQLDLLQNNEGKEIVSRLDETATEELRRIPRPPSAGMERINFVFYQNVRAAIDTLAHGGTSRPAVSLHLLHLVQDRALLLHARNSTSAPGDTAPRTTHEVLSEEPAVLRELWQDLGLYSNSGPLSPALHHAHLQPPFDVERLMDSIRDRSSPLWTNDPTFARRLIQLGGSYPSDDVRQYRGKVIKMILSNATFLGSPEEGRSSPDAALWPHPTDTRERMIERWGAPVVSVLEGHGYIVFDPFEQRIMFANSIRLPPQLRLRRDRGEGNGSHRIPR